MPGCRDRVTGGFMFMTATRTCGHCGAELPLRTARTGPPPSNCGPRCRRLREYTRARAARRRRAQAQDRTGPLPAARRGRWMLTPREAAHLPVIRAGRGQAAQLEEVGGRLGLTKERIRLEREPVEKLREWRPGPTAGPSVVSRRMSAALRADFVGALSVVRRRTPSYRGDRGLSCWFGPRQRYSTSGRPTAPPYRVWRSARPALQRYSR